MLILYCKNTPIYDIENDKVYCLDLLPGVMKSGNSKNAFNIWLKSRYSSNTNVDARQLKSLTFGQGRRDRINVQTKAFSLSDCYWIKDSSDPTRFEEMSPYLNPFWFDASIPYKGEAVPTLYVDGFLSKYWKNAHTLCKVNVGVEYECVRTLMALGDVNCCEACEPENGYIEIINFTSVNSMFEPASVSGMIDSEEFSDYDIVKHLKSTGIDMIVVDAIFGNGDRHAGNFGFMRDTVTGKYVSAAPIFDFDHALDSKLPKMDILIKDMIEVVEKSDAWKSRAIDLCERIRVLTKSDTISERAKFVCNELKRG